MDSQQDLIAHLDALTAQMERRNSFWHTFLWGICYGVGFVIGSAVLAAILVGIFLPLVKNIPGVQQAFSNGASLINTHH